MKKYALKDVVIITSIFLLPFVTYFYKIIPKDIEVWETVYFTFGHGGFYDVQHFFWQLSIKIVTVLILILWLFSCRHWWRHAILVPLIIEISKFINLLRVDVLVFDEMNFIYSLPIIIPIIILLILLSNRVNYFSMSYDINKEIMDEIDDVFFKIHEDNNENINSLKLRLKNIINEKSMLGNKEYLQKLIELKNESLNL